MKPLRHLTYANIMSTIACIVALGTGSAYAATQLTGANIKDGSIRSADLANGTIKASDMGEDAIHSWNIEDGAVNSMTIADNSVSSPDIFDGSVHTADIADNSITGAKIHSHAITADDLDGSITQRLGNLEAGSGKTDGGAGDNGVRDGSLDVCDFSPDVRTQLGYTAPDPVAAYGCAR